MQRAVGVGITERSTHPIYLVRNRLLVVLARWALFKGGERLSQRQEAKLRWVEEVNRPLYQAYLMKEQLRLVFSFPSTTPSTCWRPGWNGLGTRL